MSVTQQNKVTSGGDGKNYQRPPFPRWLSFLGAGAIVIWLLWHNFDPESFKDRFDSLGALFSGLAFIGLVVTLVYQSMELKIQMTIQRDSQEALADTAKANQRSAELAARNLRAQFLIFWLEINKNYYDKLINMEHTIHDRGQQVKALKDVLAEAQKIAGKEIPLRSPKVKEVDRSHRGYVHNDQPAFFDVCEDARIPYFEALEKFVAEYLTPWLDGYRAKLSELEKLTDLKMVEGK